MISRSNMRRQLRASGGITNARQMAAFGGIMGSDGRKQYGIGSWLKEKIRKIIPNELADIAVKAAPFVAPFNPAIAAGMAGLGSFDKTGRIGSSLKSAGMTYGGGQLARYAGGAGFQGNPFSADGGAFRGGLEGIKGGFSSPLGTDTGFKLGTEGTGTNNPLSDGNDGAKKFAEDQGKGFMERTTDKIFDKIPFGNKLNQTVKEKLLVGGVTSAATYLYEKFVANYPEPEPGEDMAAYMAERRQRVGTQMRTYMDNYLAYDPQYSAMSDAEKDAFVERNNKNMGGLMRQNYQTGGITMANTLAQNVAQNRANQTARANELQMARSRLPGYQAPQRAMAPTRAPMLTPRDLNPPELYQPPILRKIQPIPMQPGIQLMPMQTGIQPMPMQPAKPTYTYVHEEGYEVDGPGPNIGRIENPPENNSFAPGGPGAIMPPQMTPFDPGQMQQAANWQPGQPAPEGFKVEEMLGDEFLVPDDSQYVPPTEAESMMPTPEGTMGPISLDDFESQNSNSPTARIIEPTLPVEPMTDQNIMEGYAKYKEQNPEIGMGASIQVIINGRLPDGTPLQFNNGAQAAAFNQYLESIGQPPFERTQNPIESKDGSGLAKLAVGGRVGQNMGGLMRAGYANGSEEFQSYLKGRQKFEKEMSLEELYKDFLRMKKDKRIAEEKTMAANGGLMRLNYMIGGEAKQLEAGAPPIMYSGNMDPNAQNQQAGLPSTPGPMQMAEDGPEFDMRENGGFQPLGRQEGKDDVPAMLAKNEFVMTADAVRAAGGGSIQKGAQKMYDTMKKLESRVS